MRGHNDESPETGRFPDSRSELMEMRLCEFHTSHRIVPEETY